jgi:two-component system phosphate regulon response regulator PhoB
MIKRILIADKDQEMAAILASELKSESPDITLIHDGQRLLQKLKAEAYQLLIMNFVLPELSGANLIQEIRQFRTRDDLSILVLSDPMDDGVMAKAIEAGANDFLFRPYQRGQLLGRVRELHRNALVSGEYILGKFRLNLHSSDFYQGDVRTHLTPSEFKLLETLFKNRGTILTRDQLIEAVQGAGVAVVDRAIDTHVFSLRKKLGEFSNLIETVRGVGYRISGADLQ